MPSTALLYLQNNVLCVALDCNRDISRTVTLINGKFETAGSCIAGLMSNPEITRFAPIIPHLSPQLTRVGIFGLALK